MRYFVCVYSGESGAGKTESTKLIIKQLIELCRGNTQLEQQILQVKTPRGGTLFFSTYVGSGPASTVPPKKISGFSSTPKRYLKF